MPGKSNYRMKTMDKKVNNKAENTFDPAEYFNLPYSRVVVPEEDGTFRAEILEFPGCIAIGDTEADALTALKDVALSWLESVVAAGKAVPQPMENIQYSGKLVLRMPRNIHKKAAFAAERDGISLNQFIVSSVAEQIGMRSAESSQNQHLAQVVLMPFLVVSSGDSRLSAVGQIHDAKLSDSMFQMPDFTLPTTQLIESK